MSTRFIALVAAVGARLMLDSRLNRLRLSVYLFNPDRDDRYGLLGIAHQF